MLGDGHGYAGDVHFLKTVSAEVGNGNVSGNGYERNGIHICRGDAGYEVRCARPGSGDADARFAGGAGIAVRRVRSALFVRGEYVAQFAVAVDCVVNVEDAAAGVPEYGIDALFLQTADKYICAAEFHKLCSFHASKGPMRP